MSTLVPGIMNPSSQPTVVISQLLEDARQELDMGIAYYSEFTRQTQRVQDTVGDTDNIFGLAPGTEIPIELTYCRAMLEGIEPPVVPDTSESEIFRQLGLDQVAGCYIGAPLRLSDGRVFGSVCCLGRNVLQGDSRRYEERLQQLAHNIAQTLEQQELSLSVPEITDSHIKLSLWFSGIAQAPQAARNALKALQPYMDKRQWSDLRLLITELMTNSIRHSEMSGEETIGLDLCIQDALLYGKVLDPGVGFTKPDVPHPHEDKTGGYGLVIMDYVTEEWSVERDEDVFRVSFCMKTHKE